MQTDREEINVTDEKKPAPRRTEQTVRDEIAALAQQFRQSRATAGAAWEKADRAARMIATTEVGKIARTFTAPALAENLAVRDKSLKKAAQIRDAAIAAAHGEFKKATQAISCAYEIARDSINATEREKNRPFGDTLAKEQFRLSEEHGAAQIAAKKEYEAKVALLEKELKVFAGTRKVETSEIPLKAEVRP